MPWLIYDGSAWTEFELEWMKGERGRAREGQRRRCCGIGQVNGFDKGWSGNEEDRGVALLMAMVERDLPRVRHDRPEDEEDVNQ